MPDRWIRISHSRHSAPLYCTSTSFSASFLHSLSRAHTHTCPARRSSFTTPRLSSGDSSHEKYLEFRWLYAEFLLRKRLFFSSFLSPSRVCLIHESESRLNRPSVRRDGRAERMEHDPGKRSPSPIGSVDLRRDRRQDSASARRRLRPARPTPALGLGHRVC